MIHASRFVSLIVLIIDLSMPNYVKVTVSALNTLIGTVAQKAYARLTVQFMITILVLLLMMNNLMILML